jgi:hypothetical protein
MNAIKNKPIKASHDVYMLRSSEQIVRRPPIYLNGAYPMVGHRLLTSTRMSTQRHTTKRKLSLEPAPYSSKRTAVQVSPVSKKTAEANVILLSYTSSMKRQFLRSASANADFKPMLTERNLTSNKRMNRLYKNSATFDSIGGLNHSVIRPVASFDTTPVPRALDESVDESLVELIDDLGVALS